MKSYSTLLRVYIEQVQKLETLKAAHSIEHRIEWIPHVVLNRHLFIYDEYLQNSSYGGFCFEEKNLITPYFVQFMATYDCSPEETKKEFEKQKPKNVHQGYLDVAIADKSPFIDYLKSQLKQLRELEYTYKIPSVPSRKNAIRQIAKYEADRKEYLKNINSLNRCRSEINERIKLVETIKKELEKSLKA